MSDFSQLVRACLASGVVFSALCAMVIVPLVLWLGVRAITPRIERLNSDPQWQAPLAAIAAALPGLAFGALALEAVLTAPRSQCLTFVSGRVIFGIIVTLAVAALVRATVLSWRRHAEVRTLLRLSHPPSPRVAAIAHEVGLVARSLPGRETICALGGTAFPAVLLSEEAERRLSDAELRAAFLHERAHRDRADQWLIALITFAGDALPLDVRGLVAIYRHARELAADRAATRTADDLDLASAIVRLSSSPMPSYLAGLSGEAGAIGTRLEALLSEAPFSPKLERFTATALLAFLGSLAATSLVANLIIGASCARMSALL